MKKKFVAFLIVFAFFINLVVTGTAKATQTAPEKYPFSVKTKENYVEILKGNQVVAKILPPELLNEIPTKKEETQIISLPFIENGMINWRVEKSEPSNLLFLSHRKNNSLKLNFHTLDIFYKITSPYIALKDEYQSAQLAFSYNFEFKRTPRLKDDETINIESLSFLKTKILSLPEKIKLTGGRGTFKTSFSIPKVLH